MRCLGEPCGAHGTVVLEAPSHREERAAGGQHRSNVRRPWAVVRYAAGLASAESAEAAVARLHDLRHSFTTVVRGLGYGDHVIAALIGHTVRGGMTSRYGDVPDALVRAAADAVSAEISRMLGDTVANRTMVEPIAPSKAG